LLDARRKTDYGVPERVVNLVNDLMSKSDEAKIREQRLAAKLRENLRKRKDQARARQDDRPASPEAAPLGDNKR